MAAMKLALIAHDHKKDDMVALAAEFQYFLKTCQLIGNRTTGGRLNSELGLAVECLLSGPLGGDLQIGARLAVGEVDAVIFLRDPMTPQPLGARHQCAGARLRRPRRALRDQCGGGAGDAGGLEPP